MTTDADELELRLQLKTDPVRNFKPRPTQERCYTSKARWRWCGGANRCLGGEQEIYDPVLDQYRRVDSIPGDFHVLAWNGSELVVAPALRPFTKAPGPLNRYWLSNGQSFVASPTHVVLASTGDYVPLSELPVGSSLFLPESISGTSPSAHDEDDRHSSQTTLGFESGYSCGFRPCGEPPRSASGNGQGASPLLADVRGRTSHDSRFRADGLVSKSAHNHLYQLCARHSSQGGPLQNEALSVGYSILDDGTFASSFSSTTPSASLLCNAASFALQLDRGTSVPRRHLEQKCYNQREAPECYSSDTISLPGGEKGQPHRQSCGEADRQQQDCESYSEPLAGQINADEPFGSSVVITSVGYIRDDVKWDFTVPGYHNYWCGGIIHHNSGKSAQLSIEAAAAARRIHPTRTVQKPTTGLILAPSREQLQDPWEKKLLKDCELTGFVGRPLIPESEILKVYRTHGAGAPTLRQIDLRNGNIIRFGVSKDPESWKRRAGQQLAWIILDEAEGNMNLLNELYPRLLDANKDPEIVAQAGGGWLLWGATPTTANVALMKFIADCEDPKLDDWQAFRFNDGDSDAIDLAERVRLKPAFSDEDYELRMRGTANFVDRLLIYGRQFDDNRHMRKDDYEIKPDDNIWCGYDPGGAGKESHDTGIGFFVIRKEEPRKLIMAKYIKLNRTTLGYDVKIIANYLRGRKLEGFVPDPAVAKTEKGSGKTIRQQLREEMIKEKIITHRGLVHVHNFHDPGIKRVQSYLENDLIEINPSYESGGQLARQGLISYRSYEAGVYQGIRGVVKTDDEFADVIRYIIMAKPIWMPRPCGEPAWAGPAKPLPPPQVEPVVMSESEMNYQMQLQRSARMAAPIQRSRFRN